LPASAKRLVLVDTTHIEHGVHNWEGFLALDEVVDMYNVERIFKIYSLYEIWQDEWTVALMEAGYDSIATVGCDGPEEYVLNDKVLVDRETLPNFSVEFE
jgi:hypothetical protein